MDAGRAVLRRRAIQSRPPPSARRELIAPRYLRQFATLFTIRERESATMIARNAASREKRWANKTVSSASRGGRGVKIDRRPPLLLPWTRDNITKINYPRRILRGELRRRTLRNEGI